MSEQTEKPITAEDIENLEPGQEIQAGTVRIYNDSHLPTINPSEATPVSLLSQALAQGLDTETLEKFMDLQERYEAGEARKAFAADMAKAQAKMQPIVAAAENDHTSSYYAKLGTIAKEITPIYGRYGFSVSFGMAKAEKEGEQRTTARVLHKLGHFEDYHIDLPPDDVGSGGNKNKTAIHARISSNTYGKRTLLMGIFNLSVLSEDDDGNLAGGVGSEGLSPEQLQELQTRMDAVGIKPVLFAREFGFNSLDDFKAKDYDKLSKRLEQIAAARSQS